MQRKLHNSNNARSYSRTQTQQRFEEGVTGNTKSDVSNFCVARYIEDPTKLRIEGLTSRNDNVISQKLKSQIVHFLKFVLLIKMLIHLID